MENATETSHKRLRLVQLLLKLVSCATRYVSFQCFEAGDCFQLTHHIDQDSSQVTQERKTKETALVNRERKETKRNFKTRNTPWAELKNLFG